MFKNNDWVHYWFSSIYLSVVSRDAKHHFHPFGMIQDIGGKTLSRLWQICSLFQS